MPPILNVTAAWVEAAGNMALIGALVHVGRRAWPYVSLKQLAACAAVYAMTNVFYSFAYIGRELDLWALWGTPIETGVRTVQIGSMWAMLLTGIESVVAARE